MKITMLKKVKHATNTYIKGQTYDVAGDMAYDWIESGYASLWREEETPKATEITPKRKRGAENV